jgi:hypothetical protein
MKIKFKKKLREILRTIQSESSTSTFVTGIENPQQSTTHTIGRTKTKDVRYQDSEK